MNEDAGGAQLIQNNAQPQVSDQYLSVNNALTSGARGFSLDGTLVLAGTKSNVADANSKRSGNVFKMT